MEWCITADEKVRLNNLTKRGGMVEGQYRPEMSDCTGQRLGSPNVQTHGAPRGIPRVRLRT